MTAVVGTAKGTDGRDSHPSGRDVEHSPLGINAAVLPRVRHKYCEEWHNDKAGGSMGDQSPA